MEQETVTIDKNIFNVLVNHCVYSFIGIQFEYESLTAQEKALITKEEFDQITKWCKSHELN